MNSSLQVPDCREQPGIPASYVPAALVWTNEQPRTIPRPDPPVGSVVDDILWQDFNREPFRDGYISALDNEYVIEDRAIVTKFIEQNRLGGLLSQAIDPLNEAFGKGTIKTLRLQHDDEGSETLSCLVMTRSQLGDGMFALQRFDDRWWIGHCAEAVGRLNFDFELV